MAVFLRLIKLLLLDTSDDTLAVQRLPFALHWH